RSYGRSGRYDTTSTCSTRTGTRRKATLTRADQAAGENVSIAVISPAPFSAATRANAPVPVPTSRTRAPRLIPTRRTARASSQVSGGGRATAGRRNNLTPTATSAPAAQTSHGQDGRGRKDPRRRRAKRKILTVTDPRSSVRKNTASLRRSTSGEAL